MGHIIERQLYSKRIEPFVGKNIIKVLTGQRRVGKSCILRQIRDGIQDRTPDTNIIYINKEYAEFASIQTHTDLSDYLQQHLCPNKPNALFIDEVQDIVGFEHALRSVQAKEEADIFITGSNAKMLSGELATHLSGRYVEFPIHSLGYAEFLLFHNMEHSNKALRAYLTYGGLPYLRNLQLTDDIAFEYLRNVYSTILLKDVVQREGIRNIDFLETLARYTGDNVGSLFSASNISKYLKSQRVNMATIQVINYLHALQNAYLIHKVSRVEINGLKKFEVGDKFYFEDLGLRNCQAIAGIQQDIAKLMENAVYLHLIRLGYQVFTGQLSGGREIDFVAIKQEQKAYVQVSYLINNEQTRQREFGNLKNIADNYPKYVVSLDEWTSGSNVDGIAHIHLGDFLLLQAL